jgi:hypothetical protein
VAHPTTQKDKTKEHSQHKKKKKKRQKKKKKKIFEVKKKKKCLAIAKTMFRTTTATAAAGERSGEAAATKISRGFRRLKGATDRALPGRTVDRRCNARRRGRRV